MSASDKAALAESMRLVNERHMPCHPEAIALLLDEHLAVSPEAVSAKLVPIRNDRRHSAWIISYRDRVAEVVTGPVAEPSTRPAVRPASEALLRARRYIAEYRDRSRTEALKDEPPIVAEHLSAQYQERVYGLQIVAVELVDPDKMLWRVTAVPVRKGTMGGEIWMRFSPETRVGAEFGK